MRMINVSNSISLKYWFYKKSSYIFYKSFINVSKPKGFKLYLSNLVKYCSFEKWY